MFSSKARKKYLAEINAVMANWPDADAIALEKHLAHALKEVTHLTEYQDEKASRIMTAMAFVGALVAAVHALGLQLVFPSTGSPVLLFNYSLWGFYIFAVVGSAIVIWGIKPRYNIPKDSGPKPLSVVFGPEIHRVTGTAWANEWVGKKSSEIEANSAKNMVREVKLIAEKADDKTWVLALATNCYVVSLVLLAAGIIILGYGIKHKSMPAHSVIVFDADNTLWDTNALYTRAQENLVKGVERLAGKSVSGDRVAYLRRLDEEIAHSHPDRFRYPIQLLIERTYYDLKGTASSSDPLPDTSDLKRAYLETIASAPRLLPGAREALAALSSKGSRLVLLSEGDPKLVEKRLCENAIDGFFHEIIVQRKTVESFAQIRSNHTADETTLFVSVGDRLDVDIDMAREVGYKTIHVPGGFKPYADRIACLKADYSVVSLNELPAIIDTLR